MRIITATIVGLVVLGVAATHSTIASAAPNQKECPAGVTLNATASGNKVTVAVSSQLNLKPAKDADLDSFHLHYFIDTDPATVLQPGQGVPSGNPKIVHSAATTQEFKDLTAGAHRIWVVLGDVGHVPCSPLVVTDVTLSIAAAPSTAPATGTGAATRGDGVTWPVWIALAGGGLAALAGLGLRRQAR